MHLLALSEFTVVFEAEGVVPEYKDRETKGVLSVEEKAKVQRLAKAGTLKLLLMSPGRNGCLLISF